MCRCLFRTEANGALVYGLHVNTPSGNCETHAMAIEFTQRRAVNEATDGDDHLVIPRLTKAEMSAVKFSELSAVTFEHYHCPKKPITHVSGQGT